LNNIKDSVNYPATLIMTSEFDDRVPPLHSYKFAAKLQNRPVQKNPVLLRVEKGAGHYGATSSLTVVLKEYADMYDFILYHLMKK
jgi:prolyl oligopeptidase